MFRNLMKKKKDGSGQPKRRHQDPAQVTETSASPTKPAKKRRRKDKLAPHNASPSAKKTVGSKRL